MSANRKMDAFANGLLLVIYSLLMLVLHMLAFGFFVRAEHWMTLVMVLFMLVYTGLLLYLRIPRVELEEHGIWVRFFIKKRFHPWVTIRQAGVLWRMGRGFRYNQLVLLKANGSPRRYRDKTFLPRNVGKLIRVPLYSAELRSYVVEHYGSLDFDLSNGREEVICH